MSVGFFGERADFLDDLVCLHVGFVVVPGEFAPDLIFRFEAISRIAPCIAAKHDRNPQEPMPLRRRSAARSPRVSLSADRTPG